MPDEIVQNCAHLEDVVSEKIDDLNNTITSLTEELNQKTQKIDRLNERSMKLLNENRCHHEKIKGSENHQNILKEHVIDREKMINIQENKIKIWIAQKIKSKFQHKCNFQPL